MSESKTTYYQRHKETILNITKDYYENNKDELREIAKNKYTELSEEEKDIKREYGKETRTKITSKRLS